MDRIGVKDRKVVEAFTDGKGVAVDGHKLSTDGTRLWMGVHGIAQWVDAPGTRLGRVVEFGPNGSRSIQFVQRQVRHSLPAMYLEDSRTHRERGRLPATETDVCARCGGTSETCGCVGAGGSSGPFSSPLQVRCERCLGMGYKGRYRGSKWKIENCPRCLGTGQTEVKAKKKRSR